MANPKFEKFDGTSPYVWDEFSSLPGDRPDLTTPMRIETYSIEHKRNNVIVDREIITTKGVWNFIFRNISQAMVTNLKTYAELGRIRFYPDSANPLYFTVYWISKFNPILQRGGGKYNLSLTLLQR